MDSAHVPVNPTPTKSLPRSLTVVPVPLDLQPGELYQFRGIRGNGPPDTATGLPPWRFPPGLFRLIGTSRDSRTFQDGVNCVGIDPATGEDDGNFLRCSFWEWSRDFTRVESVTATATTKDGAA
jgi:hypothetical protein